MRALYLYIILIYIVNTAVAQEKTRHAFFTKGIFKGDARSKNQDTVNHHITFLADWPASKNNKVVQALYSHIPADTVVSIELICHQLLDGDSAKLYHSVFENIRIRKNASVVTLNTEKNLEGFSDPVFFEIVNRFHIIPPGDYITMLYVVNDKGDTLANEYFYRQVDSTLRKGSGLRDEMNKYFLDNKRPGRKNIQRQNENQAVNIQQLSVTNSRLTKKLKGKTGVTTEPQIIHGGSYSALYFKGRFLGRYEIVRDEGMLTRIKEEQSQLKYNPGNAIDNNFTGFTTVSSGIKDIFGKKEEKERENGFIDIASNWANGQQPGSEQDNNFQEFKGQFNTEVLNIPISIEGFYTTQDKNRVAKASYFRLHYDVQKVKSNISEEVGAFKSKYQESKAKAGNFDFATQAFVNKLKGEKNSILNELRSNYGVSEYQLQEYQGDINAAKHENPNLEQVTETDAIAIREKYQRIARLQKDIDKYSGLVEQYRKGLFFDSVLVQDKLKGIEQQNTSPKALAKSAEYVLPEGKTKKLLAGLTSLDIGILNEYESKYTLAGQTLKGAKAGYDFNVVTVTAAVGKTEYISRDGNIDRYNSSMVKLDFKPVLKQQFGLIYYLNSPTKQVFESKNFHKDISVPTFKEPVHIASVSYAGVITKNLSIQSEGAVSYRKSEKSNEIGKDNTALTSTIDYTIQRTGTNISAEWEHIGRLFENSSLPYLRAATERYTFAVKSDFFKSFLSVGVQYNLMKLSTFVSTGHSRKWGFDIKTHSKRYPTIYLSYKPFSTFRSYADTLAVQQKPMLGEVWVARGMYRIRRKHASHNFVLAYNKSTSSFDTVNYASNTLQGGYIFSTDKEVININAGWSTLPVNNGKSQVNYFMQAGISHRFSDEVTVNLGLEGALAPFGWQRLSAMGGCNYRFEKLPLAARVQLRYGKYQTDEFSGNKNLFAAQAGINFHFGNR